MSEPALSFPPPVFPQGSVDLTALLAVAANDGYDQLRRVLTMAVEQAARGKGKERHATPGDPFELQQIVTIGRWLGSFDGEVFQACKKAIEAKRLPKRKAINELLGSINYLAAAVLLAEILLPDDEPAT
jgi:hypothetical protein